MLGVVDRCGAPRGFDRAVGAGTFAPWKTIKRIDRAEVGTWTSASVGGSGAAAW
jgi:hypothetical protein